MCRLVTLRAPTLSRRERPDTYRGIPAEKRRGKAISEGQLLYSLRYSARVPLRFSAIQTFAH